MKVVILTIVLAFLAVALAGPLSEQQTQFLFSRFVDKYNKEYESSRFFKKYNTFKDNLNLILAHNARDSTYKLAMNQFGDLTTEEFKALHKLKTVGPMLREQASRSTVIPRPRNKEYYDWTGKMNPVKNQGSCGSCWAFSTIGTVEGTLNVNGKGLFNLSEQQLVDCASSSGNEGCNGGLMDLALDYAVSAGGFCEQKDYPYSAKDGTCADTKCKKVAKVASYEVLPKSSEAIGNALASGPVAVALAASSAAFQFYTSGVITKNCGEDLNHAVIAVGTGYDEKAGVEYYMIRNSWGDSWGDKGHVRVQKGNNTCGLELHNWNVRVLV